MSTCVYSVSIWFVERRVHAKAGTRRLVVRLSVLDVHGACTTMPASSLVAMLRASFVSEIIARSLIGF